MNRLITMQDISCIGKCSLTVALPVLSAMGIEAVPLPTAVLSAHTMFKGVTFHDLTDEIEPIMKHWKKEGLSFAGIYTGYLGSFKQLQLAEKLFNLFDVPLRVVDPCMADHGKLYTGFTMEYAKATKQLCAKADVICPNMSEACLLLGIPYCENPDEDNVRTILKQLTETGCKTAVITGISLSGGKTGAYAYNRIENTYSSYQTDLEPQSFHGTGDIWASVFAGSLVNGKTFEEAMKTACEFVREAIHLTLEEENHNTYGTNFEQALPYLMTLM